MARKGIQKRALSSNIVLVLELSAMGWARNPMCRARVSLIGPPSPFEAQSMVARKGIPKRAFRSNKVFKATSSVFGLTRKCRATSRNTVSWAPPSERLGDRLADERGRRGATSLL